MNYRSPQMIAEDAARNAKIQEEWAALEADARQAFNFTTGTWYKLWVPKSLPYSTENFTLSNELDNWRTMTRDRLYNKFREEWAAAQRLRRLTTPPPPAPANAANRARMLTDARQEAMELAVERSLYGPPRPPPTPPAPRRFLSPSALRAAAAGTTAGRRRRGRARTLRKKVSKRKTVRRRRV